MLFRSPRCYFWCTAGARYEHAPNFSCPEFSNIDVKAHVKDLNMDKSILLTRLFLK